MQETHSVRKNEKIWRNEWGGNVIFSHYNSRSRGVAILFRKGLNYKIEQKILSKNGRFIIIEITVEDITFVLVNVYAPNEDSPTFFTELFQTVDTFDNPHKLYAGDFNVVRDPYIDRVGTSQYTSPNSRGVIDNYVKQLDLIDYWRYLNPEIKRYTWMRKNPQFSASRLDYWLVSPTLAQLCTKSDIPPAFLSDHSPITLQLATNVNPRGKGVWMFNNSLLDDEEYIKIIHKTIEDVLIDHHNVDPRLCWEAIKLCMRGETIKYASYKKSLRENKISALERKLLEIECSLGEEHGIFTDQNEKWTRINEIKQELNDFVEMKTKGAMIRSKATFLEYGEKMSSYYFKLEQFNQKRKSIHKMKNKDGGIITHNKQILQHQKEFYQQLYAQKSLELQPLPFVVHPLLQQNKRDMLSQPLSITELDDALSKMCTGKTPGPDGFSVNFYNKFWQRLREPLYNAHIKGLEEGELHQTAYQGLIVLLPKKHRDLLIIENWRPLTLLNNDYKILSKALALRMQKVLPDLISEEQVGFMKGRFIGENLLSLQAIMEFLHVTKQEALLLSIDIQRAFDEIPHEVLWNVLDYFHYHYVFVDYLKTLYKCSSCAVLSNGWVSEYFRTYVGVKQGDAISSFLFLNVMQVLSIILENKQDIEVIDINGIRKFYGMYADDVWNVVKNNPKSLKALMEAYELFHLCTGLNINYNKTEVMRIGSLSDANARMYSLYQLKWTSGPVRILGVDIYNDPAVTSQMNFKIFSQKFHERLHSWQNRGASLLGRILIVNTLLVSQLVFKMLMIVNFTDETYAELKKIIMDFIWDGKRPKIAYKKLILNYKDGGLKLHDLKTKDKSLKISWVPKLLADTNWAKFMQTFLPIPASVLFRSNISPRHVNRIGIGNCFLKQVLKCWAEINFAVPKNLHQIYKQMLWYNSCTDSVGLIYYHELQEAGVCEVQHIFSQDECRFRTCAEISARHNISINFIQFYRIVQSIPHNWKVILRANIDNAENILAESWYSVVIKGVKISRDAYWFMIDATAPQIQGSMLLWSQDLNVPIDKKQWTSICKFSWKISLCTKLRLFQYKVLQRCLVTNINLYYYKMREDKLCTFCRNDNETVFHLLWLCPHVRRFWSRVFDVLKNNFHDNRLNLDTPDICTKIIFNRVTTNTLDCINTIILIAKRFIYVSRCTKMDLNIYRFIEQVMHYKNLEKYIAIKNHKLDKYAIKWEKAD